MPSSTDDPVYRWLRLFGLAGLAAFGYLMVLGPLLATLLFPSSGAASALEPATNRGVAEAPPTLWESLRPWVAFGLPVLAGVVHVWRGFGGRPLGVFLVVQVGVSLLVAVLAALAGGVPGSVSLVASYLVPAAYVVYDRTAG
ncbi:hypothetical protein [Halomarina oriensis]|uniref:Uncharacterized protein n=1 Tax=Halomarina oriensis TaxID=671145 RepID=A0A6B0GQ30_9EURY|nr:hypothetical protein [Halomarina oriensis]MWG36161.1 hypothetical protein [Halomarina oriensis]